MKVHKTIYFYKKIVYNSTEGGDSLKVTMKAARVNAGLTQNDVFKAIGVGRNVYVDIERGRRPLTEEQRDRFCKLVGISPKQLDCQVLVLTKS